MAWENRGNNQYLYRKVRIGDKVKTVYLGRSEAVVLLNRLEKDERKIKTLERKRLKLERKKFEMIDDKLNSISEINQNLVDALFLINGFHQHKRQWRKKRK